MEMDNTDRLPAKLAAAWNLTEGENGIRPFFICVYFTKFASLFLVKLTIRNYFTAVGLKPFQ